MESDSNSLKQNEKKFDLEKLANFLKNKQEYKNVALQFDNDLTSKYQKINFPKIQFFKF
jgi:diphthamide synthase subunit DPH2